MKKLIRNKLAKKFLQKDSESVIYLTDEKKIRKYLALKIVEEAREVAEEILKDDFNEIDFAEEVADLTEILNTSVIHFDVDHFRIDLAKVGKFEKKGGFSDFALKVKKVK